MNQPIIRVEALSKRYRIQSRRASYSTLRESLSGLLRMPSLRGSQASEDLWALRDVCFEVGSGDAVAVVGSNGAGKSTLLKILSRITEPTSGRVELYGRVASLLEVGTGFHHELTGRENIYLNGAILGMRRAEIVKSFDAIVDFAGVERFLDEPVKHYSSGMYMRLAFAVAAHLQPEILVVDEVLAVGDAEFQQKCLGKMSEAASSGRTVLFVTHNMQAATSFCNKGVFLEGGRLALCGTAEEVVGAYLQKVARSSSASWKGEAGGDEFRLASTRVLGSRAGALTTDQELRVQVHGEILKPLYAFVCGVELWSARQQFLAYSAYDDDQGPPPMTVSPGPFAWELTIPPNTLATGTYELRFDFGLHHRRHLVDRKVGLLVFTLENPGGIGRRYAGSWTHVFRPAWRWRPISPAQGDAP